MAWPKIHRVIQLVWVERGGLRVKTFVVILSALVFLVIAALHVYRIYAGIPVLVGSFAVPMAASWYAAVATGLLGLLLLISARK